MSDRLVDLFIKLCLQNNELFPKKRITHFHFLTYKELSAMEQAVEDGYKPLLTKQSNKSWFFFGMFFAFWKNFICIC